MNKVIRVTSTHSQGYPQGSGLDSDIYIERGKKKGGSRISPTLPSLRTNVCLFTYGGGSELLFPFEGVYLLTAFLIGLCMQFVLMYLLYRFVRKSRSVEREAVWSNLIPSKMFGLVL